MIGEFVSAQAWWNSEGVWMNPRQAGTDRDGISIEELVLLQLDLRRSYY